MTMFVSLSARTGIILAVLLLITGRAAEMPVWGRRARLDATVATIGSDNKDVWGVGHKYIGRRAFARHNLSLILRACEGLQGEATHLVCAFYCDMDLLVSVSAWPVWVTPANANR